MPSLICHSPHLTAPIYDHGMSLSTQALSLSKQAKCLTFVTHFIVFTLVLNCLLIVLNAYNLVTEHFARWRKSKTSKVVTETCEKLKHHVSKSSKNLKSYSHKKKKELTSKSKSRSKSKLKLKSKSKLKSISLKNKLTNKPKTAEKMKKKSSKDSKLSKAIDKRQEKMQLDSNRHVQQQNQPMVVTKLKNVPTDNEKPLPPMVQNENRSINAPPSAHIVFMSVSERRNNATTPWLNEVQTTYPVCKVLPSTCNDASVVSTQKHPSKCPGTSSFGTQTSSFSTVSQLGLTAGNESVAIQMPLGPPNHEALRVTNATTTMSQSALERVYQPNEVPSQFVTDGVKTAIADGSSANHTPTALTPTQSLTNASKSSTGSTGTTTEITTITDGSSFGSVLSPQIDTTTHGSYAVTSKSSTTIKPEELQIDVTQSESMIDLEKSIREKKSDAKKFNAQSKSNIKTVEESKSDSKSNK